MRNNKKAKKSNEKVHWALCQFYFSSKYFDLASKKLRWGIKQLQMG
jgi:hypothetical protein